MIYFISDTHFGHDNIIKYCDRPFDNSIKMNKTMIDNWNSVVKNGDTVYHLGDVAFLSQSDTIEIMEQLNGYKILIMGNHDRHKTRAWWLDVGFDEVISEGYIFKEFFLLSHEPLFMTGDIPFLNIHGHIHNNRLEGKNYANVSVEQLNYTPISFDDIKAGLT